MLSSDFFNRDALEVARELLGKVIRRRIGRDWLSVKIIETEAYYLEDKASHASLGFTEARRALFMKPGTIYMYYARGNDSLNFSCMGEGNAVLIKSAVPFEEGMSASALALMMSHFDKKKPLTRLCSGQTLLCRALSLKVPDWNAKQFKADELFVDDVGYRPKQLIKTLRLGIPKHRDPDLMYRLIDFKYEQSCTDSPLRKRTSWPYLVENY